MDNSALFILFIYLFTYFFFVCVWKISLGFPMLQLDLSIPSTSSTSSSYDPAPLDCSKRAAEADSNVAPAVPKRKKISYAIEDLLKKDDS